MSFTGKAFALMCVPGDKAKNKGLGTPDDIVRFDNIRYGTNKKWNRLDVYRPKQATGKLPVLIDLHGGGWVYGDKELYQFYCMEMAQHGFAVVNFTYGLAPKFPFPSSMVDTDNVVRFVLEHAEEFGFDTSKVFFAGDSAGAHMAAMYACICTNPVYAVNFPFEPPKSFVPTAMLLNCGVYDAEAMVMSKNPIGKFLKAMLADLLGHKLTNDDLKLLSPVNYVTEKFPPCYIMTANGDFLRGQPKYLKRQLDKVGVPYVYKMYGDRKELLMHVFHCDLRKEIAHVCNREEAEYLLSFCKEDAPSRRTLPLGERPAARKLKKHLGRNKKKKQQ